MTTWTGSVPTIASGDTTTVPTNLATYRDALKALSEAWTTFSPTWTASSVNPAIGNGTIAAAYMRVNKYVTAHYVITMGGTTTYGTGTWIFTLPTAAASRYVTFSNMGSANAVIGASSYNLSLARYTSSTTVYMPTSSGSTAGTGVPAAWASGSVLSFTANYEAA